jgi:hypothetical protein
MWIVMPRNTEAFSCQQQAFRSEGKTRRKFKNIDEERHLTRVPDHFAPILLSIPGYEIAQDDEVPQDIPDLPKADPLRDGAIGDALRQIEALKSELQNVRGDLEAANARSRSLLVERDNFVQQAFQLNKEVAELKEKVAELEEDAKDN